MKNGFTIIELIVVIAIIAVLAGIVLSNVTSYITSSKNAAIKANLSTLTTAGTDWFASGQPGTGSYAGSYKNFCGAENPTYVSVFNAIANAGGTDYNCSCDKIGGNSTCVTGASKWCACVQEISDSVKTFCVDSTGYKKRKQFLLR